MADVKVLLSLATRTSNRNKQQVTMLFSKMKKKISKENCFFQADHTDRCNERILYNGGSNEEIMANDSVTSWEAIKNLLDQSYKRLIEYWSGCF